MTGGVVVVTGTGTDVGKTIASAALAAAYAAAGRRVAAVKAAQTGVDASEPGDLQVIARLAGVRTLFEAVRLPEPLAPDTAARRAGVALPTVTETAEQVVRLAGAHDVVLVEGAGGLLVRLDDRGGTIADLANTVRASGRAVAVVVIVTACLGTLNHTELTIEALRARNLEPAGLIIGSWPASPDLAERCNIEDLLRPGVPMLGRIPAGAGGLDPLTFRSLAPTWLPGPP